MTPGKFSAMRPLSVFTSRAATGTIALNNCTGPEQSKYLSTDSSLRSSVQGEVSLSQLVRYLIGACA
jgi:hypothetical protein